VGASKIDHRFTSDQILSLDEADLKDLGFALWSEDNPIWLIPLWVYNFIADGEKFVCISGERVVKGKDYVDLDVRMGCIAYGLTLEKEENNG